MPDNDPAGDNSALKLHVLEQHPLAVRGLQSILRTFDQALFHSSLPQSVVSEDPLLFLVDLGTLGEPWEHLLQLLRLGYPHARVIVLDLEFPDDRVIELLFLGVIGFVTYESVERELPAGHPLRGAGERLAGRARIGELRAAINSN